LLSAGHKGGSPFSKVAIDMRKRLFLASIVLASVASCISISLAAEEVEMDMDLMQNIEDTNKSLSSNIAQEKVTESKTDAQALDSMFAIVETHFVKKGDAENAVDLAKKSRTLATTIIQSVDAKNFESATNSATELSRACRSCHTFYKKE
jgi:hypothetical protein